MIQSNLLGTREYYGTKPDIQLTSTWIHRFGEMRNVIDLDNSVTLIGFRGQAVNPER